MKRMALAFIGLSLLICATATAENLDIRSSSTSPALHTKSVGRSEIIATLGLGLSAAGIKLLHPEPRFGFRGGVLFDDQVRAWLRVKDETKHETIRLISDVLQISLIAAPFADSGRRYLNNNISGETFLKQSLIDAQSFVLAMSIILASKTFVGRLRPKTPPCAGGDDDLSCASSALRKSFISGHTTASFTGAGLLCTRQASNSKTKIHWSEKWICPSALAIASGVGLMRIMSDDHYATDVLAGAAVGLLSGYLLPRLLYETGD